LLTFEKDKTYRETVSLTAAISKSKPMFKRRINFKAELENHGQGCYHGYPMPQDDPFRNEVLKQWLMA
jgi:hypothetical protein